MKAEFFHESQCEEIVFPENTFFVNVMAPDFAICSIAGGDIAHFLGWDSVLYERDIGGIRVKLFAWIDDTGKLAGEFRRQYAGLEMVRLEYGGFLLKIIV